MIENMELGYTPNNLRALRKKYNLTQQQVANIFNSKNWQIVTRWETSVGKPNHSNMPHDKWVKLIEYVNNIEHNQ